MVSRVECSVNGKSSADTRDGKNRDSAQESEWIVGLREGQPQAFLAVYQHYRVRIYSFLLRLSGRRDLADDLLQDTFVQLARHATRLPPETRLAPWLYTVARNRYLNQRRTAQARWEQLRTWFGGQREPIEDVLAGPQHVASQRRAIAQIEQAIQTLAPPLREVILLVCIEELEQDQAAQILGIAPAALRKRLERGRSQLRALLNESERGTRHDPVD